jgi:haloacetate dehalogenase
MFENFKRKRVPVGDVEIACVIGGEGPPVLMLHGYPQSLAMWARVAPKLAERYTVVCADLRGYGDSGKPRCLADHST